MTHSHQLDLDRTAEEQRRNGDPGAAPGRGTRAQDLVGPNGAMPSGILMRKASGEAVADGAGDAVSRASSSSSQALPDELRTKFEGSLGADLSAVRIHTGSDSAQAASSVGARAYAVGNDIHFGAGQYDPSSRGGQHLIAHEVAHTVQQAGTGVRQQNKLEVSSVGDSAEVEADRAADAMVSGQAATVTGAPVVVARSTGDEMNKMANEGQQDVTNQVATQAPPALVVSNVRDTSSAQALINQLQAQQPLLEQGVSTGQPGVEQDQLTQNGHVITDLQMFLSAAGEQGVSTSNFQRAYAQMLLDFGRIEGMCKRYADTSIKNLPDAKGAQDAVDNQVGIDGHDAEGLQGLMKKLQADTAIKGQLDTIHGLVQDLEGLPDRVEAGSQKSANAISRVGAATTALRGATNAYDAQELEALLAPIKAKAAKAAELTTAITGALTGAAKDVGKGATAAPQGDASVKNTDGKAVTVQAKTGAPVVDTSGGAVNVGAGMGKLLLGGLTGGAVGLLTVGAGEVWKVVQPQLAALLQQMDIAVGEFPDKREDTAASKKKQAAYDQVKSAAEALRNEKTSTDTAFKEYFADSKTLENKKSQLRASMDTFGQLVEEKAAALGKKGDGKKIHEMAALAAEAEAFIAQGKLCVKIGQEELDANKAGTGANAARTRLADFNTGKGQTVHLASKWYGPKARPLADARAAVGKEPSDEDKEAIKKGEDPNRAEHISVYTTQVLIDSAKDSKAIAPSPEESKGLGSADSSGVSGGMGANETIKAAVQNAQDIVVKASAYVQALNSMVFGGALSPGK